MIIDRFRLDGKVAVVTGGTKGIGKAVVISLSEAGADIAVVSRKPYQNIHRSIMDLGGKGKTSEKELICSHFRHFSSLPVLPESLHFLLEPVRPVLF